MTRVSIVCAGLGAMLVGVLPTRGMSQSAIQTSVTPPALREALLALSDDSLSGRLTGSMGAAKAASFIQQSLTRLGVRPAGDQGKFTQDVPLVRVQIDSGKTSLKTELNDGEFVLTYWFTHGVDYQPFTAFGGLTFPRLADGGETQFGGRLGSPNAARPDSVAGKTVIFLPPLLANGQPDYQVWNMPDLLASYWKARALLIVSLELMPASVRRAMDRPYFALRNESQPVRKMPAVIAISKATASMMRVTEGMEARWRDVRALAFVRQASSERVPDAPTQNIVAMIEGTDPVLKSEYVVLSARIDQADVSDAESDMSSVWPLERDSVANGANAASGAAALLEIARQMSEPGNRPRRSIILLWTVGQEHGRVGSEWFVEHSSIAREKIAANIDVDLIARRAENDTATVQPRCDDDGWSFAKRGIPSVLVTAGRGIDGGVEYDDVSAIDFVRFARATGFVGALATEIANRPARDDKTAPAPKASCVQ